MVHLFVVYGYQGAEEDAEKVDGLLIGFFRLFLLRLRWLSVLVNLCLLLGTLMLILRLFPVWLRAFLLEGMLIWPLLYSRGAGLTPGITCTFNKDDGTDSRRDFCVVCPNALAASQACYVTE